MEMEMEMEIQLSLALPGNNNIKKDYGSHEQLWPVSCIKKTNYIKEKRSSDDAFRNVIKETTQNLPLLVWNGQPNEEGDRNGQKKKTSCMNYKINGEENQVVGWPPIKSWRRKLIHEQHGVQHPRGILVQEENALLLVNPLHVKVKMEGVPILRKINLRLYDSYQNLSDDLINNLFVNYQGCRNESCYTVIYQDREGDWLLAGDVPWQTFLESVQQVKVLRGGK